MSRCLALEKSREGASNLLLEDPDVAAILEMTKEKLSGLVVAGTQSCCCCCCRYTVLLLQVHILVVVGTHWDFASKKFLAISSI